MSSSSSHHQTKAIIERLDGGHWKEQGDYRCLVPGCSWTTKGVVRACHLDYKGVSIERRVEVPRKRTLTEEERAEKKRERNKRHYQKCKVSQEKLSFLGFRHVPYHPNKSTDLCTLLCVSLLLQAKRLVIVSSIGELFLVCVRSSQLWRSGASGDTSTIQCCLPLLCCSQ